MSDTATPSTTSPTSSKSSPPHTTTPAYLHSWRHSPPIYTAISVLIFLLFFIQPHSFRVAVWSRVRPLIEDERLFLLIGAVAVHSFIFIIGNLVMTLIYSLHTPFFEQFKIVKTKDWPWRSKNEKERTEYWSLIKKTFPLLILNQYLIAPTMIWFAYPSQKHSGMNGDIDKVPHWYTSMLHITISMLIEDTLFYWAHRTLHHPRIYGHIHKVHHQYKTSIGIASEYAHPIEFIFSNAIPFSIGPSVCGMHYWTFFMWSLLRIGETIDGHSGYEFPWSPYRLLPFSGSATGHDYHHTHNVGNYASFFVWWDYLCETDVSFRKYERKLMEQQQQMEGRAEGQQQHQVAGVKKLVEPQDVLQTDPVETADEAVPASATSATTTATPATSTKSSSAATSSSIKKRVTRSASKRAE